MLVGHLQRLLALAITVGTVADPLALVEAAIDGLTESPEARARLLAPTRAVARQLADEPRFARAEALASQAGALAAMGEAEAHACTAALRAFATLPHHPFESTPDSEEEPELRAALAGLTNSDTANASDGAGSHSRLLESIVAAAAQAIGARYGSLFLIDEDSQELVFEVSLRERLEDLRNIRVPLGRGIAGLVAMSAQPIAVSDVRSDPRHAAEVAEQTGYTPKSMLCVPLQHGDRVIGVLELLDKTDDADTFSLSDMQALGPFADRAARAIDESRRHQSVLELVRRGLRQLADWAASTPARELELAGTASDDPDFRDRLELGRLVLDVATLDAPVSSACAAVLRSVTDYALSKARDEGYGQPVT
jgi:GAF domain-containing protein